ncbi:hypothetical protein [Natrinema sp. HArc-T2]|uniref:hypothetical protein n=1 Tax=Natrinema sp. HArc-T2 TaxID=3242701 RepID=UPI00359D3038
MSLQDWAENARDRFERDGVTIGVYGAAQELWQGGLGVLGRYVYNYGMHVFERDWDVLLVLDTCRPDVLGEVSDNYEFLDGYDPDAGVHQSVGSRSAEWTRKTFDPDSTHADELAETALVSANPYTRTLPDPDALGYLDEIWKYAWDDDHRTVRPEIVMDRAVDVSRTHDFDRMVVHFMQPHTPYRSMLDLFPDGRVGFDSEGAAGLTIWEQIRTGRIDTETVWEGYRDNLRWVLDEGVEPLLRNVDANTVVLTSDHGEGFGEYWYYGHSSTAPLPILKRVPWAITTASDMGEYEPRVEPEDTRLNTDEVKDRLQALGYA